MKNLINVQPQDLSKRLQRVFFSMLLICFFSSTFYAQSDYFKKQNLNTSDTYFIAAKHTRKVFDVGSGKRGTPITQYSKHGAAHQQFRLVSKGNGYYSIKSVKNGKSVAISDNSKSDGAKVVLFDSGSMANQQFKFIDKGNGYCEIQSKHSGKYLDVTGSSKINGAKIVQYKRTNNPNQLFKFVKQKNSYTHKNYFIPANKVDTTTFESPCGVARADFTYPDNPSSHNNTQKGYSSLDFFITVNKEAPDMYWAQQFQFLDGDNGYVGLQNSGNFPGESDTKIAIFSIWDSRNAEAATGGNAEFYDHEGSGYSCKIKYDWKEGRLYRIRLHQISDAKKPNQDEWWGAWIMDVRTMQEELIGKILIPGSWKWLDNRPISFTEYFGQQIGRRLSCDQIPYSKATFTFPKMNGGYIKPKAFNASTYGDCKSRALIERIDADTYKVETGLGVK